MSIIEFLETQGEVFKDIHTSIATSTVSKAGLRGTFAASVKPDSKFITGLRMLAFNKDGIDYLQILAPENYQYAQLGRRPGKMPPIEPIRQWAIKKGLADPKEALSIAFAVAKTIAKRGTAQPPYYWIEKTAAQFEPEFKQQVLANGPELFFEAAKRAIQAAMADSE